MPEIGGKRFASSMIDDLKMVVAKEMSKARALIGSAVDELAAEIRSGSESVAMAVHQEAMGVREEFGTIVGNATAEAADAVAEAKKVAAEAEKQAAAAEVTAEEVPKAEAVQTPVNPTPPQNEAAA